MQHVQWPNIEIMYAEEIKLIPLGKTIVVQHVVVSKGAWHADFNHLNFQQAYSVLHVLEDIASMKEDNVMVT